MSIFDPTYIDREIDTKLKSLVFNRLNKDKFDELSSHSPDEIWFIQDSELSGQPIVVDTTPRPTKLSEFENDVPYLTTVSWYDIQDRPNIPYYTSQLTNDSGYVTSAYVLQQRTKWRDWFSAEEYDGLKFTAEEANSTVAMQAVNSAPQVSLEYSTDMGMSWSDFIVGETTVTLPNVGSAMFIRAKTTNARFAYDSGNYNNFVLTGKVAASGSIMYLLKSDGDSTTALTDHCFNFLFGNQSSLTTSPDFPALTLAPYCYQYMFNWCEGLVKAADILPATTLAEGCYWDMYSGCTHLTKAPYLPATELAPYCY